VDVDIIPTGLFLKISSGSLIISEVGSGRTAAELGILTHAGSATSSVQSSDLTPQLTMTTRIDDMLGRKAMAVLRPGGNDNDIILSANFPTANLNGVTVSLTDDVSTRAGKKVVATYDASNPADKKLIINLESGNTTAAEVIAEINAKEAVGQIPFTAKLDPLDDRYGGQGLIYVDGATAVTAYGQSLLNGAAFDKNSGLQILNNNQTVTVDFADCTTLEDMLNKLNNSGAGVLAEINGDATGIDLKSRLSGSDFAIGENGGQTAAHLGLRTFTGETQLADLNFGRGVDNYAAGADFTITRNDGVSFDVDLTGELSIQEVIDLINNNPVNAGGAAGSGVAVQARLSAFGNGIELVDNSIGTHGLTVTRAVLSTAAIDLGLVASGKQSQTTTPATAATATLPTAGAETIRVVANGTGGSGVRAVVQDSGGAPSTVAYDAATQTLTFSLAAGTTDLQMVQLFDNPPANQPAAILAKSLFSLSVQGGAGGSVVTPATQTLAGTSSQIKGDDVHHLEVEGLFTALIRLHQGLETNDNWTIERGLAMLDTQNVAMNFSRAELGARQQGLDVLTDRLDTEDIQLRETLSLDYDVDIAEVISDLTARQTAYEASLRAVGQIAHMTLLSYL
jgi:flagellin-like hook-associated protein FlgL